jgi:hypothetical protein
MRSEDMNGGPFVTPRQMTGMAGRIVNGSGRIAKRHFVGRAAQSTSGAVGRVSGWSRTNSDCQVAAAA